jgi:alkyl-hydroperoxide reductase/thiol specific antioxidant family protein
VFCREHALQLQRAGEELATTGGEVVLVGLGAPAQAAEFKRETGVPFRLLVSPDKAAYRAMDLKRGSNWDVLGPRALAAVPRAVSGGGSWRRPRQDWHQLGGAFVIAPGGRVVWAHRARHSGDNAPPEALVAAFEEASERGAGRSPSA